MTTTAQEFNDSFASHMIRDFFLALVAVIALELAIGFGAVLYDYHAKQPEQAQRTADGLADDVRAIMNNKGGPVAARTVFPILKSNHEAIGMEIAIEPAPLTVDAIEARFEFTPKGIPAQWPPGRFTEATVDITAEDFCIGCHITANVGDVLGTVTVRRYLMDHLEQWWEKLPLATTLGMGKIILHTIVLYFLLRSRMASLLSLKSVVSVLAKAGATIDHRAPVRSHDEFGELSRDLNLFLDRVGQITDDLGGVLTRVTTLNERLSDTQRQLLTRYDGVQTQATYLAREATGAQARLPALDQDWVDAMRASLRALADHGARTDSADLNALLGHLQRCAEEAARGREALRSIGSHGARLSGELREFAAPLREMALIENS